MTSSVGQVFKILLLQAFLVACFACACSAQKPDTKLEVPAPAAAPEAPVTVWTNGGEGSASAHSNAIVPVTPQDPQWGNSDAPVTIVEFGDFECPFTARGIPTLKQIKDVYGPEQVRIVWKHLPLAFHKNARPAHIASATAFALGGSSAFWKFHDRALENQRDLTPSRFNQWAQEVGVSRGFEKLVQASVHAGKVDDDLALSAELGVTGTPSFLVNGIKISGAQPFDKFKVVIDEQLAEARRLVTAGTDRSAVYATLTNRNFKKSEPAPAAQAEPEVDKAVWKVPVLADDPSRGPKDAPVTIVQFSDFECPFCKRVEPTLQQILDKYPKDVRIVWKDNPLPFHKRAKPAAIVARIAYKTKGEKAFWNLHKALFESQAKLEDDDLKTIAEAAGLRWAMVQAAFDKSPHSNRIEESMELASDVEARGTPHFFINGVRLAGAQPFENFDKLVSEQLEIAKALTSQGIPRAKVYEAIIKEGKTAPPPEKKEVALPPSAPSRGPVNAKVVIQIWSDFQCPFCKRVSPTLAELEQEYGKQVKFVWRNMPLAFHKHAQLAAEAAHEVFEQKGNAAFWAYHDKLLEAQSEPSGLERENLEKLATGLGLDMARFRSALDSRKHKSRVDADAEAGTKAGISGTPGFLINGYYVSGAQPLVAFRRVVRRALSDLKATKAVAK